MRQSLQRRNTFSNRYRGRSAGRDFFGPAKAGAGAVRQELTINGREVDVFEGLIAIAIVVFNAALTYVLLDFLFGLVGLDKKLRVGS